MLAFGASGCSGLNLPFGDDTVAVTGTTERNAKVADGAGLSSDDLLAIGSALAYSGGTAAPEMRWSNPDSGSEGRITRVRAVPGPGGGDCRAFRTTVNAVDGVRAMSGIACRADAGAWTIEGLAPSDDITS